MADNIALLAADLAKATKLKMPAMVVMVHQVRALYDRIEALTAQLAEAQQQASKLWALLDDIDTLDDSCRGDDDLFRTLTRAAQLTRHAIMTGEEWDAARADPVRDTLADSDGDDGA